MKLPFTPPLNEYHQYCANCFAETVQAVINNARTYYACHHCGQTLERSIVIDPKIRSWIDKTGEYWHESAGVFVRNPEGKFLFFQRTVYPFSLTIPAGHVNSDEQPALAAQRELAEEVGLSIPVKDIHSISSDNIRGDSCRRGADDHHWHAYLTVLPKAVNVHILEEGQDPVWLTPSQVVQKDVTVPVRFYLENYHRLFTEGY